jgi:hypothetical protein
VSRDAAQLPLSGEQIVVAEPQLEMAPELVDVVIGDRGGTSAVRQPLVGVASARLPPKAVAATREPFCLLEQELEFGRQFSEPDSIDVGVHGRQGKHEAWRRNRAKRDQSSTRFRPQG